MQDTVCVFHMGCRGDKAVGKSLLQQRRFRSIQEEAASALA